MFFAQYVICSHVYLYNNCHMEDNAMLNNYLVDVDLHGRANLWWDH